MSYQIRNPIIPGFYPDPSICRVGRDFYLACSSFEMDPGIPVFHSTDLANWELIGNAVGNNTGLPDGGSNGFSVPRNGMVGGVMAPTIRYFNGKFYIIDSNAGGGGNFIISADDPAGPWTAPYYMDDVPGIDASLFFDDDGSAYMIGTGNVWDNGCGQMERGIWVASFDIENYRCTSEPFCIFNTALRAAASPEAPHLYRKDGYYYLILAEGGTEFFHAVCVARGRSLQEFFEGYEGNPVMTHRHMGRNAYITNVGHADLVELPDGSWYAVMLASRPVNHRCKTLGRETFACPVVWEDDWPVFSPETGKIENAYDAPACLKENIVGTAGINEDFDGAKLPPLFTQWGTPDVPYWRIADSALKIRCIKESITEAPQGLRSFAGDMGARYSPYIAVRQTAFDTDIACTMDFVPAGKETAGIAIAQAMNNAILLEKFNDGGKCGIRLVRVTTSYNVPPYMPGFECSTTVQVLAETEAAGERTELAFEIRGTAVRALADGKEIGCTDSMLLFPDAKSGGMVGTMIGMYATGNGEDTDNEASFDRFVMN